MGGRVMALVALLIPMSGCLADQVGDEPTFEPYDVNERYALADGPLDDEWRVEVGPGATEARMYVALEGPVQGYGQQNLGYCFYLQAFSFHRGDSTWFRTTADCPGILSRGDVRSEVDEVDGLVLFDEALKIPKEGTSSVYAFQFAAEEAPLTEAVVEIVVRYD